MSTPKTRQEWAEHFRKVSAKARAQRKNDSGIKSPFGADNSPFGAEPQAVIQQAQAKLNDLGYGPLTTDGIAGPMTQAATKKFQAAKGLTADGVIGPQTLGALGLGTSYTPAAGGGVKSKPKTSSAPSPIPGLKTVVVENLPPLFGQWEGKGLPYMYTDSKGFVTTGTGNLIDPISAALPLNWRHGTNGPLASQQEITAGWNAVKNGWPGVQSVNSQSLSDLRLNQEDIDKLVLKTVANNHNYLQTQYPGYVNWPADAQMAMHSLSWAWGPAFANVWGANGAKFKQLLNQAIPDFHGVVDVITQASGHEESINPGIIPRNVATKQMFANAGDAIAKKANPNSFFYPGAVVASVVGLIAIVGAGLSFVGGTVIYILHKAGKV